MLDPATLSSENDYHLASFDGEKSLGTMLQKCKDFGMA